MKHCPHCGETYADFVDFCFGDGSVLTLEAVASVAEEPDSFDAPPPPKMLQGSQQRASYTRSATPVPRARRPGRSLIGTGGADYSPPTVDTVPPQEPRAVTPPPPVNSGRKPEPQVMRYGNDDELEGDDAEVFGALGSSDSFDGEGWEEEPAAYTPSASEVSISKKDLAAARAQEVLEDEEEESSGTAILAFAVIGFFGVAMVAMLGVFTLSTFFYNPDSGGETDGVVAVPVDPEPVAPEPIEPEPVAPEPVEPEPVEPLDPEPVEPVEPVDPEPTAPEPVEPEPIAPTPVPEPVRPDPVRPTPTPTQPAAAMVSVNFVSTPSAALLTVDGRAVATTPFNYRLSLGPHTIRITKDGFEPHEARVNVGEGTEKYTATLQPIGGAVAPQPVAPEPVAPEPAQELVQAMLFLPPPPGVVQVAVVQGAQRIVLPVTIAYPPNGTTLVFELTAADGVTWQSAVKCGPTGVTEGKYILKIATDCGPLKGRP